MVARVTASLFSIAIAGSAHAQGGHDIGMANSSVNEIWRVFESTCTAALSDPAGFAADHPANASDGQPRIAISDDDKVVIFYSDPADPVFYQMEYLSVPGSTELVCDVHGVLPAMNLMGTAGYEAQASQDEAEFRALIGGRPGSTIGGGPLPVRGLQLADLARVLPEGQFLQMKDRIFAVHTPFAGETRFVYTNMLGGTMAAIGHYSLPPHAMPRLSATATAAPAPEPSPATVATSDAFAEAVRANLALAIELCIRTMPLIDQARESFAQAGFTHRIEDFGGGDLIHWYGAPADTVNVALVAGGVQPECRVSTSHMGVTEAVAFAGAVGQQRFPALNFQYTNMENTPPVTAQNMGQRWEFCTGWIGWNGQKPVSLSIANGGNDPACIEDGSSQIVVLE